MRRWLRADINKWYQHGLLQTNNIEMNRFRQIISPNDRSGLIDTRGMSWYIEIWVLNGNNNIVNDNDNVIYDDDNVLYMMTTMLRTIKTTIYILMHWFA